jgi:hypothetical protein
MSPLELAGKLKFERKVWIKRVIKSKCFIREKSGAISCGDNIGSDKSHNRSRFYEDNPLSMIKIDFGV